MRDRFYLASAHGNTGSNMVWHCHNKRGYHTNLVLAHTFTRKEAQEEFNQGICQPVSADHVDALSIWKVDHQYIPFETILSDDVDAYVLFQAKRHDGNDVYWMDDELFNSSTDFSKASVYTRDQAERCTRKNKSLVAIPYSDADQAKRRVFEARLFNPRIMVQGAGLRIPKAVKLLRRRVRSPKVRFNCPKCGKLNWQHNPYDFEVCKHCDHIGD
ncbi:hypothetical protein [Acinetobacter chengduensis]|uniref:Uncharacterized protein n=1 Tax=Acinetobacter chengduensis TaxID=2420890 RepID=A0ABX9TSL6_9GAMM|nr:hypothetical protein [Acinetobacter chengduensis]RLL19014.1 hypothetical protein D9K81_14765 [Acinetobacter chengduensis]